MSYVGANTGYIISNVDIGANLITKDYLIDVYPNIVDSLRTSGLWVWGSNQYGQFGDSGPVNHRSSPVQSASGSNWAKISFSTGSACGIKTDGTLWAWGNNIDGKLGLNDRVNRSSPVQLLGSWLQVDTGSVTTFGIRADGTLWGWGRNNNGQLGLNDLVHRSSPVQILGGGTNWRQVACVGDSVAAIKTDSTLWTWGLNQYGQLGSNIQGGGLGIFGRSSPAQISGINWKQVKLISSSMFSIKTDNTLWSWGRNNSGQLGDNTALNRSSPVQVAGTNWKELADAGNAAGAIKTDNTLWAWGLNQQGQLGVNDIIIRSSPVQIAGTNWLRASLSGAPSAGIKTDGSLWVWGVNSIFDGRLGTNNTENRSSPVQTAAGGNNWRAIAASSTGALGIRDNSEDFI
jgi:alpha-tubulin suppressor-like RCC1 family protein